MAAGAPSDESHVARATYDSPDLMAPVLGEPTEHSTYPEVVDQGLSSAERELLYRVRDAVDRYEPIRASRSLVQVGMHDGAVVLRGRVRSDPLKVIACYLARSAAGDRPVVAELVSDTEVVMAVATALALDPRTNLSPVFVECSLGSVRLYGPVPTAEMAAAAEEVARALPQVAQVRNELEPAAPAQPSTAQAKAEVGATAKPIAETAYTSEPRLEPHSRTQDADRVTRPENGERVPVADT